MPFSDLPLTSGQTVAEGERYMVRITPAGTFRIAHRTMPEKGVNFMWLEKWFSAFKGKAVSAEETDEIRLAIIAKCPMRERQALLIEP